MYKVYCVKLSGLIRGMDWVKEEAKLQKERALGNAKHRKMVKHLFFKTEN